MPAISRFFGIVIAMYYDDHEPAHFHVRYAEHSAKINIETLELIDGELPRRAIALTLEWAALHREQLRQNWSKARQGVQLMAIEPLE
ncbi:MAG: DUF4160 domain-containing protein [Anaerolineae bacterium]|nr:DUF4160 domain-containing protein [Thermoflexales bacterium]HQW36769.1 DUF4160 domain-containing protein [Thermoflexales bacterium]